MDILHRQLQEGAGADNSDGTPPGMATSSKKAASAGTETASPPKGSGSSVSSGTKGPDRNSDSNEPTVIKFNETNFSDSHVFVHSTDATQLSWTAADDDVVLQDILWLAQTSENSPFRQITNVTIKDGKIRGWGSPFADVSSSSLVLNLTKFSESQYQKWLGQAMKIQIDWETDDETGETTSGIFAITAPDSQSTIEENMARKLESNESREGSETRTESSDSTTTTADPSESSGATALASEHSGGGGLSKGAIAGIVIGTVLGVALIAGLLAFLWRRRRRQGSAMQAGYSDKQASNAYMVDKEATRAHVTDSPRSPYSDDGHGPEQQQQQEVPLDELSTARDSPYHDRPGSISPDAVARAPTAGSGPTVAHLIEEGMTDEEIRRLEEEERQLDDEIERHGRRR